MHRFTYKRKALYCEEVPVALVAKKVGTPFYLYSLGTFLDHYFKLRDAFAPANPTICFSMKANSNLTVLKALVNQGCGLDIVSGGELKRAKRVGADPAKIVYASVGKTEEEIEEALRSKILMFNVESEAELETINKIASRLGRIQKVAIRLNPDVASGTHHYITTGTKQNKFGLSQQAAYKIFMEAYRYPHLKLTGVHVHIGSQITESGPFIQAIKVALAFIDRVHYDGGAIEYLNIGGGMGIIYSNEKPQTARDFTKAVLPLLLKYVSSHRLKIIIEPGRFISGNSGIFVTKVLYKKTTPAKNFIIVDGGMNDLIRPSFYGAYHEIVPVNQRTRKASKGVYDVVGPICESGDFLAKDRPLPLLQAGDLLALMSAGAYGFVMSSNYNSRPRAAEVAVRGKKFIVVRKRESFEDLVRHEIIAKEIC